MEGTATMETQSTFNYRICGAEADGIATPVCAGEGKYALVFQALQESLQRKPPRYVAIKILREKAELSWERQLDDEITLLEIVARTQGEGPWSRNSSVVSAIDVLTMPPLILCGCGKIYQPKCPEGHNELLSRRPTRPNESFPVLACSQCNYEVSAERIDDPKVRERLLQSPAKTCCDRSKPTAKGGTIINFAHRKAIVMPLIHFKLHDFFEARRVYFEELSRLAPYRAIPGSVDIVTGPLRMLSHKLGVKRLLPASTDWSTLIRLCRVHEKIQLMLELIDAVAWLHEHGIVHRDLASDNVMIYQDRSALDLTRAELSADVSQNDAGVRNTLQRILVSNPYHVCLVDFGLADTQELRRSWYDKSLLDGGQYKQAYWSPEARRYHKPIDSHLEIQILERAKDGSGVKGCFRADEGFLFGIEVGDTLVDSRSTLFAIRIVSIVTQENLRIAYFEGTLPPSQNTRFASIPQLGEVHDLYGLGALLYYVLSEDSAKVERLASYADLLSPSSPKQQKDAPSLEKERKNRFYIELLEALGCDIMANDVLGVCLKSMVRGRAFSYARSRTERGSKPVECLAKDLRKIYWRLHQEVIRAIDDGAG
jgi:serine/threonine protein kinase